MRQKKVKNLMVFLGFYAKMHQQRYEILYILGKNCKFAPYFKFIRVMLWLNLNYKS